MNQEVISMGTMLLSKILIATNASSSAESLQGVTQGLIQAIIWISLVIALGVLMIVGIKYVTSGANERANLKGKLPIYVVGVGLIVMCVVIVGGLAEIAGNENEEDVFGAALEGSGAVRGEGRQMSVRKNLVVNISQYGARATIEYQDENGKWQVLGTTDPTGGYNIYEQFSKKVKNGTKLRLKMNKTVFDDETVELLGWRIGDKVLKGNNVEFVMGSEDTIITALFGDLHDYTGDQTITMLAESGFAEVQLPEKAVFGAIVATPDAQAGDPSVRFRVNPVDHKAYEDGKGVLETQYDNGDQLDVFSVKKDQFTVSENGVYEMSTAFFDGLSDPWLHQIKMIQMDDNGNQTEMDIDYRIIVKDKSDAGSATYYKVDEYGKQDELTEDEYYTIMARAEKGEINVLEKRNPSHNTLSAESDFYGANSIITFTGKANPDDASYFMAATNIYDQNGPTVATTTYGGTYNLKEVMGDDYNPATDTSAEGDASGYIVYPDSMDSFYFVEPHPVEEGSNQTDSGYDTYQAYSVGLNSYLVPNSDGTATYLVASNEGEGFDRINTMNVEGGGFLAPDGAASYALFLPNDSGGFDTITVNHYEGTYYYMENGKKIIVNVQKDEE